MLIHNRILLIPLLFVLLSTLRLPNAIFAQTENEQTKITVENQSSIQQKLSQQLSDIERAYKEAEKTYSDAKKSYEALNSRGPIDGVTALILLIVGSFVVDRVTCLILFGLSRIRSFKQTFPAPATIADPEERAEARFRLVLLYHGLAIFFAIALLSLIDMRFLERTGINVTEIFGKQNEYQLKAWVPLIDICFTGLIIVFGAERVAQWLNMPGTPGAQPAQTEPIVVTGEMVLRQPEETDVPLEEQTSSLPPSA